MSLRDDATQYDAFFSYHWRDRDQVEAVARDLHQRGVRVFLDRWYLAPGRPWPQALERALTGCRAAVVFVGPAGLGPWQQREILCAGQRGRNYGRQSLSFSSRYPSGRGQFPPEIRNE